MPAEYRPKKLFTIDEANRALPLIKAIAQDMARVAQEMTERRHRLAQLRPGHGDDRNDLYTEELQQIERVLQRDAEQLREYIDELLELGVEPKNPLEGLVDFPCEIDGRIVYLCWKLDEPQVLFWHELDAGFAGRQPLMEGVAAGRPPTPTDEGVDS